MSAESVKAMRMATENRLHRHNWFIISDQGTAITAPPFNHQNELEFNTTPSMTDGYDCYKCSG
jgi:hypothetical protein